MQDALAHGQPVDTIPLHTCACPPCFSAVEKGGKISCQPKCDLQYCDLEVGVCHAQPGQGAPRVQRAALQHSGKKEFVGAGGAACLWRAAT